MKNDLTLYKQTAVALLWLLVALLLCRLTHGYILILFTLVATLHALRGKYAWPLILYAFMSLCIVTNNAILLKEGMGWGLSIRGGYFLLSMILMLTAFARRGPIKFPIVYFVPFLLAASFSIYDSWVPVISALKLLNFAMFVLGLSSAVSNMHRHPDDMMKVRSFLLAVSVFLILGSVIVYPFPQISYSSSLGSRAFTEDNVADLVADFFAYDGPVVALFNGVTYYSQTFAPLVGLVFTWVMCDMLFIERRFRWLHFILLILAPPLIYLTRSRVGFTTLASGLMMICFYTSKKIALSNRARGIIKNILFGFVAMCVIGGVIFEIKNQSMSRWIRKTDDVSGDNRSWKEAFTSSRMGLIEQSMMEFRRNPMFGSGFQVAWYTKDQYDAAGGGFVISAPIEKGILPMMVIGETGVVGAVTFAFFCISFICVCINRRYFIMLTLFAVFFVINLGEATFLSPGGGGGIEWVICMAGGLLLDTMCITNMTGIELSSGQRRYS